MCNLSTCIRVEEFQFDGLSHTITCIPDSSLGKGVVGVYLYFM